MGWLHINAPRTLHNVTSAVVAQRTSGLSPSLRFLIIREHLYVRIHEDARQPCLPGEPLVFGDHGDLVEVVVVFAAEELDLLPGHVEGVANHRAQVEQQIQFAGGFQFVQGLLFEGLEVGDGKFAEDGHVDQVLGLFDGDHFIFLLSLKP